MSLTSARAWIPSATEDFDVVDANEETLCSGRPIAKVVEVDEALAAVAFFFVLSSLSPNNHDGKGLPFFPTSVAQSAAFDCCN
jgi:hypothetical protein